MAAERGATTPSVPGVIPLSIPAALHKGTLRGIALEETPGYAESCSLLVFMSIPR